jgi:ABC-2 type transport system ATP-binding protein
LYSIETKSLTKSFGNVVAVNDISFSVKKGEIFGFLGPNGAGKSTP